MSRPVPTTFAEALSLPLDKRLELMTELLDSVEGPTDPEWDRAWAAELNRRMEGADQREERGSSWAKARQRIVNRLANR